MRLIVLCFRFFVFSFYGGVDVSQVAGGFRAGGLVYDRLGVVFMIVGLVVN